MSRAPVPSAPLWPPSGVPRSIATVGVTVPGEGSGMAGLSTYARPTLASFMVPAGSLAIDFWRAGADDQGRSAAGRGEAAPEGGVERAAL